MWILSNCILFIMGTVSAIMGMSFYMRNRDTSGNMRIYILLYGIFAALWCMSYALIGVIDNFDVCELLRKPGILAVQAFLLTELFLVTESSGVRRLTRILTRLLLVGFSVVDFYFFSMEGLDIFVKKGSWTTWHANPEFQINRNLHTVFVVVMFLVLFVHWILWYRKTELKRMKRFLMILCIANFGLIAFCLPDTFMPMLGLPSVSTSGFGAAVCTIVVWYGATQLNSFDIRMGNITEKLFEFIDAGIIVFNTDREMVMENRYSRQFLDSTKDGAESITDIFDVDEDTVRDMFLKSLDEVYVARLWSKRGNRAYSVSMSAIKDNFGDPFCFLCAFFDMTKEIDVARKLEMASNAKSRFLAQMSHEIRTPINAVLGMNEMILRESKDKAIIEYAENIDSAGTTLLALINSILDFSKIEDGKMDIVPVKYDTASFVNDLVNSIAQRAEAKGLELKLEIDSELPSSLYGDDVRFAQVIMNLLTNAVKYTERGSVTFTMRVVGEKAVKKDEDVSIFVSVADTGMGIKKEDMDKLAVSFERLEERKNRNIEGTGLGISIVTSLLNLMGSRLRVESTYNVGSTFSFTIDQKVVDDTPMGDYSANVARMRSTKKVEETISAPSAKVLVVDDNDMNLKVAMNLLKLCDIKPDTASSGMRAIELMEKKTYDVVLLDHMMPQMDGVETLATLKARSLIPPECRVIVLTANAVVGAKEKYIEAGFDDYLSKPISLKEMVEALKKYLPGSAFAVPEESALAGNERTETKTGESDASQAEQREEGSGGYPYDMDKLKAAGIDVDAGIVYFADNMELFCEMLGEYADSYEKKAGQLGEKLEQKDWRGYSVLIHALKSNSKSFGISGLSEMALALELAAKEDKGDFVTENHAAAMEEYKRITDSIKAARSV